jgi:PAS domain S-box-containing protein
MSATGAGPVGSGSPDALLAAVLASTSDAVVVADRDGEIQSWNTAAVRIFGVARQDALGRPFTRFLDGRARQRWPRLLEQMESGVPIEVPAVALLREDGLAVQASVWLTSLRDAAGGSAGSCIVVRDRSEEVIAQQTLAAGEERVRRSEALAGTGSFVIDRAAGSEQWSEGMYAIHRLEAGRFDPRRKAHIDIVHPDDRGAVRAAMDAALTQGSATEQDYRLAAFGDEVWIFLALGPLRDDAGRIVGISGVCQDVTVRKRAESTVRDALAAEVEVTEELRRLDALKDDFLATVSHELRTPLTSIRGYSALLGKQHAELAELIDPIERNGAEMSRLVETLLDYCRLQAGQVAMHRQPIDLRELVDRCLSGVAHAAGHLRLVNDVPSGLTLTSDADALQRILGNLIGNASRYAAGGTSVAVGATQHDAVTVITVTDDGPGIAQQHVAHLFERFFQVPGTATRRGTGIGLAIVAEYVAKLAGTVTVDSALGRGTTFTVALP